MKPYQKIIVTFWLLGICLLPALRAHAGGPAAKEWVDIPVVINIIDASDSTNVADAIKKANEILKTS